MEIISHIIYKYLTRGSIPRFIINFDAFYFYDETHTRATIEHTFATKTRSCDVNGINYPESEWVMTSL